jgi:hypothetical protein
MTKRTRDNGNGKCAMCRRVKGIYSEGELYCRDIPIEVNLCKPCHEKLYNPKPIQLELTLRGTQ